MPDPNETIPAFSLKDKKIIQIGIVVKDAAKAAKEYARLFGMGPWVFYDLEPADIILHGKQADPARTVVRAALCDLNGMQIELLQPLCGPSTHMEFFERQGEGVHHISFGAIDDADRFVSTLQNRGSEIEMQGTLGGANTFIYMDTKKDFGTILEVVRPAASGVKSSLKPWGKLAAPDKGAISLEGKKIVQVGIVVDDAEGMAKNYYDFFGVGPWILIDFKATNVGEGSLHGIPMAENAPHIKAALANIGDLQLELLQPIEGTSTHMDFWQNHGQGIHHVSFGQIDDHDDFVERLTKEGIGIESDGLLGQASRFTYMATQNQLGTIFEAVKVTPGAQSTIVPYSTYPPPEK